MQNQNMSKKSKTTLYISEADEILLDDIFIKRIKERNKTDRSTLLCEGIRLLYEREFGSPIPTEAPILEKRHE